MTARQPSLRGSLARARLIIGMLAMTAAGCGPGVDSWDGIAGQGDDIGVVESALVLTTTLPNMATIRVPADNPTPPGDIFAPPVDSSTPPATTPDFAEWGRSAEPGQTVTVTGAKLSTFSGNDFGKDTQFVVYGQSAANRPSLQPAPIQRLDGNQAAIGIGWEKAGIVQSMYLLWARNGAGYSRPVTVNETEAWWIGPDAATRGDTVSVFGRNLSRNGGTTQSWVYIKPVSGAGQWAVMGAINPYKVSFVVPASLANGSYEVWVHNGHGGAYGWSEPLTLTVRDAITYPGPIFNVQTFGATGNGSTNDYLAVKNALTAAGGTPGSTVYFPVGTYIVNNWLTIPSNTRLDGAGPNSVIKAHPTDPMHYLILSDTGSRKTIQNLTLDSNGYRTFSGGSLVHMQLNQDLQFNNVRIFSGSQAALALDGGRGVTIKNCDITSGGSGVFLAQSEQVFIDGTAFYGVNHSESLVTSWGGEMVSITNNTARHGNTRPGNEADTNGWGTRFFVGNGIWGGSQRLYIANNQTFDLGPGPTHPDQNSGELILFENDQNTSVHYKGTPTSATASTITFSDLTADYSAVTASPLLVMITGGKGVGQIRSLVSTNVPTKTITVDAAFGVIPDGTSRVFIVRSHDRVVVYNNQLDGRAEHVSQPTHVGSSGVQLFFASSRTIVANNQLSDVRWGLSLWSHQPRDNEFVPLYSNVFYRNTINNTRWGITLYANMSAGFTPAAGPALYSNVFYGNRVNNALEHAYGEYSVQGSRSLDMNLVEANGGTGMLRALDFAVPSGGAPVSGASRSNTITVGNYFLGAATGVEAVRFAPSMPRPAQRQNIYGNFPVTYAGTLPGPILEVPQLVIDLKAKSNAGAVAATVPIWNSGTGVLTWSVADNASWLTVTSSGSVADENAAAMLKLTANPAGLANGTYTATVTVTSGAQSRKLLVTLAVASTVATSATFTGITEFLNDSGTWKNRFGAQGYNIVNNASSYPSYATVSVAGASTRTWASTTTDPRALQKAGAATDRIAASWYSTTNFEINLTLGSATRQVSVYALDWDFTRNQRIEIVDPSTNQVLDSQVIWGFGGGKYLTWLLSGNVKIRVVRLSGPDAVISGLFFG